MKRIKYGCVIVVFLIACVLPFLRVDKKVDFNVVQQMIEKKIDKEVVKQENEQFVRQFYQLSPKDYDQGVVYGSTRAMGAEETAIFRVKEEGKRQIVHEHVKKRLQAQLHSFQGYGVEQTKLLSQSILLQRGEYIIFIVQKDASSIANDVKKLF